MVYHDTLFKLIESLQTLNSVYMLYQINTPYNSSRNKFQFSQHNFDDRTF